MLPLVGALAFTGFIVVALAADSMLLAATYREVAFAADAGAEAGAAMIDHGAAYDGAILLDTDLARETGVRAALGARERHGRFAHATATPDRVCVDVSQPHGTRFLGAIGVAPVTVTVTACAEPRAG
jgi:hypothetical protein